MSDTPAEKLPEVENSSEPQQPEVKETKVDEPETRQTQQRRALQAANQKRAEQAQQRAAAREVMEQKARNMLIRRFGREAVDNALGRRPAGRPTREADVIRAAHDQAMVRLNAQSADSSTVEAPAEEEEEESVDIDDEGLDQFATRVVLAHLRRTPSKKRALESAIDTAVQRYIQNMNIPAPADPKVTAEPKRAPEEPKRAPAPAPAKQRFVFL